MSKRNKDQVKSDLEHLRRVLKEAREGERIPHKVIPDGDYASLESLFRRYPDEQIRNADYYQMTLVCNHSPYYWYAYPSDCQGEQPAECKTVHYKFSASTRSLGVLLLSLETAATGKYDPIDQLRRVARTQVDVWRKRHRVPAGIHADHDPPFAAVVRDWRLRKKVLFPAGRELDRPTLLSFYVHHRDNVLETPGALRAMTQKMHWEMTRLERRTKKETCNGVLPLAGQERFCWLTKDGEPHAVNAEEIESNSGNALKVDGRLISVKQEMAVWQWYPLLTYPVG